MEERPDHPAARPPLHAAQGLLMGTADVIPGVSGGTVALVVGIYERLIASIRAAAGAPVALARGGRAAGAERLRAVEWAFVLPLAAGILTALVIGSFAIPPVREAYPEATRAVFLGLVGASVVVPWRRIPTRGAAVHATAGAAAAIAFVLVGLPPREVADPATLHVFGSAAVAICAMILPGVSGAFLLEVLGVYTVTLEALRGLDVAYIATFAAGAILGIGLFAKGLETLLARWHDLTMAALTGLMVGALRALWPWLDADRGLLAPPAEIGAVVIALLAVAAFAALRVLLRVGARRARSAA